MSPAHQPQSTPGDQLIDWDLARISAAQLAPAGPRVTSTQAREHVAALRKAAAEAVPLVHQITGIVAAEDLGGDLDDVKIVDRAGWSTLNAASFRKLLGPAMERLAAQQRSRSRSGAGSQQVGSAIAGAEFGGILAFLSAHVLGQFDPFSPAQDTAGTRPGQLLLVAPNVLHMARELRVDEDDFRLWVCLHEQTHRVQFAAAPWLGEYLQDKIQELTSSGGTELHELISRLPEALKEFQQQRKTWRRNQPRSDAGGVLPEKTSPSGPQPRLQGIHQSRQNRQLFSEITAVMSLLEGHANVVMDAVDAEIIPSVNTIRRRFERRGQQHSPLQKLIRHLMQLDRKAAQYRDGQRFVSHIVEAVGMERFNRIWESPEQLPSEAEIHHPQSWLQRMGYDDEPTSSGTTARAQQRTPSKPTPPPSA